MSDSLSEELNARHRTHRGIDGPISIRRVVIELTFDDLNESDIAFHGLRRFIENEILSTNDVHKVKVKNVTVTDPVSARTW